VDFGWGIERTAKRPSDCIIARTFVFRNGEVRKLHSLFHHRSLSAADSFHFLHTLLHRRLGEKCAFLELFQDARAFVLLLKTTYSTVDRFILTDDNSDQSDHPLTVAVSSG
jgi:hypothetical protein